MTKQIAGTVPAGIASSKQQDHKKNEGRTLNPFEQLCLFPNEGTTKDIAKVAIPSSN